MEKLPIEILIKIFGDEELQDIKSLITISKVCTYFHNIIFNYTRKLTIHLGSSEKVSDVVDVSKNFGSFLTLKESKVEISQDEPAIEKAKFCLMHSSKFTHLKLKKLTFLNPIINGDALFDKLIKLHIHKCDLVSCSDKLADFIILSCKNLKSLSFSLCDGLDVDLLDSIGRQLHLTQIENLEILPTYSYYDALSLQRHESITDFWKIDKLKSFSVRSNAKEIVVMKMNFLRKMLGRVICENLLKLELIAEVNSGGDYNLVSSLITLFPNLEILTLGRGISSIRNRDFVSICNGLKNLKTLEFHFVHRDEEEVSSLTRYLQKNLTINELTLGLTKDISIEDLKTIASRMPNLQKVSVIFYNISRQNDDYLKKLIEIFPIVQYQKTGQKCSQAILNTTINNHNINQCVT